jgi:hypothetical protein
MGLAATAATATPPAESPVRPADAKTKPPAKPEGKKYPKRAEQAKKYVKSLRPRIKVTANALFEASRDGEPSRQTWTKLLRGDYVREDSIAHAIAFFNRKGVELKRTDIPDD